MTLNLVVGVVKVEQPTLLLSLVLLLMCRLATLVMCALFYYRVVGLKNLPLPCHLLDGLERTSVTLPRPLLTVRGEIDVLIPSLSSSSVIWSCSRSLLQKLFVLVYVYHPFTCVKYIHLAIPKKHVPYRRCADKTS